MSSLFNAIFRKISNEKRQELTYYECVNKYYDMCLKRFESKDFNKKIAKICEDEFRRALKYKKQWEHMPEILENEFIETFTVIEWFFVKESDEFPAVEEDMIKMLKEAIFEHFELTNIKVNISGIHHFMLTLEIKPKSSEKFEFRR